jgi:hypothetical protein
LYAYRPFNGAIEVCETVLGAYAGLGMGVLVPVNLELNILFLKVHFRTSYEIVYAH